MEKTQIMEKKEKVGKNGRKRGNIKKKEITKRNGRNWGKGEKWKKMRKKNLRKWTK